MIDGKGLNLSRRDLLKSVALTGAGMGLEGVSDCQPLTSAPLAAPEPSTPAAEVSYEPMIGVPFSRLETVRVGIVGIGSRGAGLLQDLLRIDHVQVIALCDIVKEKTERGRVLAEGAAQKTPAIYVKDERDFENLCGRDDVDLVYVATPWEWHAPMALSALNNGKHVAIEVPGVKTLPECWQIVEASEKNRRHCVMLENCCYGENEMLVLSMVRAGLFGDIEHAEAAYNHDARSLLMSERGLWRRAECIQRDGNLYPTHGLGPVARYMGINRGDRFDYLVSLSSVAKGLNLFRAEHVPQGDPRWSESYKCGDVNTSLIKTVRGCTIMLQYSICSPRPYDRINLVSGTKGIFRDYPPRFFFDGMEDAQHQPAWDESIDKYKEQYSHPLWIQQREQARKQGGHGGGMDHIMNDRLIQCIRQGMVPDIDVYDTASWAAPGPLSELSVAQGSAPVKFPDFTRGRWQEPRRETYG
jgi:predicted dehydrogenase